MSYNFGSSGDWVNAYDLDLTTIANGQLGVRNDGANETVVIDGKSWTLSGRISSTPTFVNGTGLVFTPTNDGANCNLTISLGSLSSNLNHRIRILVHIIVNPTAPFTADGVSLLGLDPIGLLGSSFHATTANTISIGAWIRAATVNFSAMPATSALGTTVSTNNIADDVWGIVWDGPYNALFSGVYASGYPSTGSLRQRQYNLLNPVNLDVTIGTASVGFNIFRGASSSACVTTLARFTIQTSP